MADIYLCEIIENTKIAESIYQMKVRNSPLAKLARPGQFANIKCGEERLLRRPISISSIKNDEITFIFETKGEGTKYLSERKIGETLDILAPLGNGFTLPESPFIVVGGGIGVPPLLYAAQAAKGEATAILGFRDKSRIIFSEEFSSICNNVLITTDDGSGGIKGNVLAPLEDLLMEEKYEAVLACGPLPMLKAISKLAMDRGVAVQLSLEERMACGVGACVVCACATIVNGIESMSRVCKDGPVFPAEQIRWD
ncbi:MAG: dihydroorotate dehydrogenase electron transfer subunit [Oscillospiraceae bacterium]|nr:dihydroorotate dehydrogenase electron transfer subunit [Oscillospiraceae bacterium]